MVLLETVDYVRDIFCSFSHFFLFDTSFHLFYPEFQRLKQENMLSEHDVNASPAPSPAQKNKRSAAAKAKVAQQYQKKTHRKHIHSFFVKR